VSLPRELMALLGLGERRPQQVAGMVVLNLLAVCLLTIAAALLLVAVFLALLPVLGAVAATVIVAVLCGLAAVGLLVAARVVGRASPPPPPPPDTTAQLAAWTRANPKQAAVMAAIAGFCVAAVPELRQVLVAMLERPEVPREGPPDRREA
jgi:hypothetical protein